MRRKNNDNSRLIIVIVVIVIAFILVGKTIINSNSTKKYTKYVSNFEKAINKYIENDVQKSSDDIVISFNELKKILINKGYIDEFDNSSVLLSANDVTISIKDNSYYNFKNEKTFENGFEIKFNYNEKNYTCTKAKCN